MDMEMTLRPMTAGERMYSYTQSQQLISQCGCIGHLRADFGSGEQFFSSWDDHRGDLKSEDFKRELDEVINALRKDERCRGSPAALLSAGQMFRLFGNHRRNDRHYQREKGIYPHGHLSPGHKPERECRCNERSKRRHQSTSSRNGCRLHVRLGHTCR